MFFIACFVFINCISAMFDSVCQSMLMLLHPPPSSARSAARLVPPVSLSVVVLPAPVFIGALLSTPLKPGMLLRDGDAALPLPPLARPRPLLPRLHAPRELSQKSAGPCPTRGPVSLPQTRVHV